MNDKVLDDVAIIQMPLMGNRRKESAKADLSVPIQDDMVDVVEYQRMSHLKVSGLVNNWHGRLRRFRRSDWYDASVLISTQNGRKVMRTAVGFYLLEWAKSKWIDDAEIEMLACDLAGLWPNEADQLRVDFGSSSDEIIHVSKLFNAAFQEHFKEDEIKLSDEMEFSSQAIAAS